jgi:hypothetical protein
MEVAPSCNHWQVSRIIFHLPPILFVIQTNIYSDNVGFHNLNNDILYIYIKDKCKGKAAPVCSMEAYREHGGIR